MTVSLLQRWHKTFIHCRRLGWREGENRLMVLMVFFICTWVLALGEDGFEKPYNIIPFYFFWGVILRMGLLLDRGAIGPAAPIPESKDGALRQMAPGTARLRIFVSHMASGLALAGIQIEGLESNDQQGNADEQPAIRGRPDGVAPDWERRSGTDRLACSRLGRPDAAAAAPGELATGVPAWFGTTHG